MNQDPVFRTPQSVPLWKVCSALAPYIAKAFNSGPYKPFLVAAVDATVLRAAPTHSRLLQRAKPIAAAVA
jgi:hypothetical protein